MGKRKRPREGRLTTLPARVGKTVVRGDPATGLSISLDRDSSRELGADQLGAGGLLLAVLHQQAEQSEECCCVRGKQRDQLLLQQVQKEHVVCEEWVQC